MHFKFLLAGGAGEVPAEAGSVSSHTAAQRWIQLSLCWHPDRRLNQPQSHTVTAGTGNAHSTPSEPCMASINEWFMTINVVCRVWSCVGLSPCTLRICSLCERRGWRCHPVKSPCCNKTYFHAFCMCNFLFIVYLIITKQTKPLNAMFALIVYLFTCYV